MIEHIVLQEVGSGRNYEIDLPCVVGRGHDANLTFQDPCVSQRHALIFHTKDQIWIEDLESANGVYVNEKKITKRANLNPGDCVQLGQTKLVVGQGKEGLAEQTLVLHSLDYKVGRELDLAKLKIIYKITAELSENQDVGALGDRIFSRLKDIFQQDRSYLALFQEDGSLQPILMDFDSESIPLSRTIVNRVFKHGESLLLEDAMSETFLKEQESIIGLRIRSALCVPLIYHNQIYGLIYLDRNIPGAFTQDDLEFMTAIAFMLGPLIENARLWTEVKKRYTNAMETLRETKVRLIKMERKAAYIRLAQAMAHEIRNPLMAIGGLVRRIAQSESTHPDYAKLKAITTLVERVEGVLKEVDTFVSLPLPHKRLERVDRLVQDAIDNENWASLENGRVPHLIVNTSRLMVPLDATLFKKAIAMILREMSSGVPEGAELEIIIQHARNELEIVIGKVDDDSNLSEIFDPDLQDKPWSLGLFLNIAHRIISDHGGKLLLDPLGSSAFPLLVRLPTTISA